MLEREKKPACWRKTRALLGLDRPETMVPVHPGGARPASMIEARPMRDKSDEPDEADAALGVVCNGSLKLEDVEREAIIATLQQNHGHRQKSATALGIGVRTLGLKLKKWKEQRLVSESL